MNIADIPGVGALPVRLAYRLNLLCDRHEAAWRAGGRPRIEDVLTPEAEPVRTVLLRELLAPELAARRQRGETPDRQEYRDRFPGDTALIEAVFAEAEPTRDPRAIPDRKWPVAAGTSPPDAAERGTPDLPGSDRAPETGATVHIPTPEDPTGPCGGPARSGGPDAPAREADGPGPRFRILRRHVRGGLGEVFVAFDEELHREVALKEIRPEHATQARSQARFLLEAEITGGLEHPGIVPVYGLGRHADGRPYYAMRFVQGHTLKEAIAGFHGAESPRRDPGERTLALRQLLRRFIDVCNALAYAHSRGVLHRDLKPANILLGPFGETLIVDWGLAKPMDRPDEAGSPSVSALRPSLAGDTTLTQTGSALGTPGFMSPEQAAGRVDRVGPPSDVYSLGATLYCVLTGRAPIDERDVDQALRKAREGEFPPPRQVHREVDPGLEAICLRAMAREPEERYPSPLSLAADLEHWLADEPISARREPLSRRARRWGRRHRTAVTGAAVVLVAVVVIVILYASEQARSKTKIADIAKNLEKSLDESKALLVTSNQRLAALYFERGRIALEKGQTGEGLLWMIETWRSAVAAGDPGWQHTARANLAAWQSHHSRLNAVFSHKGAVRTVAFSPDGKAVLTGSIDSTARLWDAATGKPIGPPLKHKGFGGAVLAVAFSPDGKAVLTGSADNTARLWDAATGKPIGPPLMHQDDVHAVAFSPDGKAFLTGSDDKTARLWDAATGKPIGPTLEHKGEVGAVAFSPDSKVVLTGSYDNTARLWDAATGKPIGPTLEHKGYVWAVVFRPDGKAILTGSNDKTARLWDVSTGFSIGIIGLVEHESAVEAVAFSPDGKAFLTGCADGRARLWDAAAPRKPIGPPLEHEGLVTAVAFSPDGKAILTGSNDNTARLWDAATGKPIGPPLEHKGIVWAVAFSPDGKAVLTGSDDKTARVWTITELPDDLPRLTTWIEVVTGLALDEMGLVRTLINAAWHQRRELLDQLGGPAN
jgi:WD40 repeat protein/serine/threonine protein kinase